MILGNRYTNFNGGNMSIITLTEGGVTCKEEKCDFVMIRECLQSNINRTHLREIK